MNLGQILSVLRARRWLVLLVFGLALLVGLPVIATIPKQYLAKITLVVDPKPDPVVGAMAPNFASTAYMATQVEIIKSDRVIGRAIDDMKIAEDEKYKKMWMEATKGQRDIGEWLVEVFRGALEVEPSRESSVLSMAVKSSNADFAAKFANGWAQAYLETNIDMRISPAKQYTSFFDSRGKELRENLERAQARLSAYQREKGIIVSDDKLDVEMSRLNELSTQVTMLQSASAESNSRQSVASASGANRMQEVVNNGMLSGLSGDISRAEARLQELNARLGDNHPQVVEAKASIAELRARLNTETQRVASSFDMTARINRQREAEVRSALEGQRAKVLKLKSARDEASVLLRDVENAQRAYDGVLTRFNQSNLESQATQGNVYVLSPAVVPTIPASPKIPKLIVMVLGLAVFAGLAAGFVVEFFDRRVRTTEELPELTGLPILGVIPKPGAAGAKGGHLLSMEQRILGRLPAPRAEG